jgi:hypothetical protein
VSDQSLVSWYEQLAEDVSDEAADIIKRLMNLAGKRPLGMRELSPFEVWARAESILQDDMQVASYVAQFGWKGVQQLIQTRDEAGSKRGLFSE